VLEHWKSLPANSMYEVSNLGNVRSWYAGRHGVRKQPRLLKQSYNKLSGYPVVGIVVDGRTTTRSVHSLVCEAFIGPRPDGMEVRHINGDPRDARADNLTYGTPKENAADKKLHGTQPMGEKHPLSKLDYLKVKAVQTLYSSGEFGYNDIAEVMNVGTRTIRNVISGRNWSDSQERVTI
jgi:hypothetical protein